MELRQAIIYSKYPMVCDWLSHHLVLLGWNVSIGRGSIERKKGVAIIEIAGPDDLRLVSNALDLDHAVVIVSRLPETNLLGLLFDFEIKGILRFSADISVIKDTMEAAAQGEAYFDETMLTFILSDKYREIHERVSSLSKRELEIIDGIMEDMTNDEIAEKFDLSVRTVNAHKRNILQKLQERSLVGAVKTMLTYSLRNS